MVWDQLLRWLAWTIEQGPHWHHASSDPWTSPSPGEEEIQKALFTTSGPTLITDLNFYDIPLIFEKGAEGIAFMYALYD